MRTRLGVNVDHVATVRQARGTRYPDPVAAAVAAELAGADQITIHLRRDRRHIQDRDVRVLKETVATKLNLEMAATDEMLQIALEVKPHMVTLVPERDEERTTEGGLNLLVHHDAHHAYIQTLKDAGIYVSVFVDAIPAQIAAAAALGAQMIELHTGDYSRLSHDGTEHDELAKIQRAATQGADLGLAIAAGHGLDYKNVAAIAAIPEVEELNIGHSLVGHALMVGFERAVREMVDAIRRA